jgi:hypothetical protein
MASVFPAIKVKLHTYVEVALKYLVANAARLMVNPADVAKLQALVGDSNTPETYEYFYHLWSQKGIKRTSTVVLGLLRFESEVKSLLRDIYDNIPARLWTDDDRVAFNRKTGLKRIKKLHNSHIEEICNPRPGISQGGDVHLSCITAHDSSRASLPAAANAVEVAYKIENIRYEPDDPISGKQGRRIPMDIVPPEKLRDRMIRTSAKFTISFGIENTGRSLLLWTRWINTKHPERSGIWTGPYTLIIA